MLILGVDTVGKEGGLALLGASEDPRVMDLGDRGRHAEEIVPAAAALLEASASTWSDVELIAVNEGPGSFTGIRVGVAFALGIAEARGISVTGVSCLDIIARACYDATSTKTVSYIISVVDVRRGEVMKAGYRVDEAGVAPFGEPALVSVDDPGTPPPEGTVVAGDGADLLWPEALGIKRWIGTGCDRATAAARLGETALEAGELRAPVPRYARPADARPRRT